MAGTEKKRGAQKGEMGTDGHGTDGELGRGEVMGTMGTGSNRKGGDREMGDSGEGDGQGVRWGGGSQDGDVGVG